MASKEEFTENLSHQIVKLTRHSYIAKSQERFMNSLKSTMVPIEEVVLQGDLQKIIHLLFKTKFKTSIGKTHKPHFIPLLLISVLKTKDWNISHLCN